MRPSPSFLTRAAAVLMAAATALVACSSKGNPCTCSNGCDVNGSCLSTDGGGTVLTCDQAEKPVGTSAAPSGNVQALGHHQVGTVVSFNVPANTASVTLIEQAVSAPDSFVYFGSQIDNTAVPLLVKDSGDNVIYDDTQPTANLTPTQIENLSAYFASDSPATGTLTIPNTTGGLALVGPSGLPSGTWTLTVSDFASECVSISGCSGGSTTSVYDVTVITKPLAGSSIPTTGTLDIAFHFVATEAGGTDLDPVAAAAHTDPDVERMVQTLQTIFAQAGITLGSVTFPPVDPTVQSTYATGVDIDATGACAPLSQLLKTSAAGKQMNIFLVSSFKASGLQAGESVVGVDGTIPGPATIGGTVASGAAVSAVDLRAGSGTSRCTGAPHYPTNANSGCGADVTAYIIAHETGHFLGLYHVTEATGDLFDPLHDSPQCACLTCAPSGSRSRCADATPAPSASQQYHMRASDCGGSTCGGGDNLMFWLLDSGALATLTTEQQKVMRANPLIQ